MRGRRSLYAVTTRRLAWGLLGGTVVASLAVVGTPVWLLQPFAPQTAEAVAWSWALRRAAPLATLVAAVLSVGLAAALWRRWPDPGREADPAPTTPRTVPRTALVALVTLAMGAAWFARQNHFEWMFRPFPDARFVAASEAHDVPDAEPVIGVADRGEALAFPITRIGYHHLVNTTLGDVPIVATY